MNQELHKRFDQILHQRTKNVIQNHKSTGILKLLTQERKKQTLDDYDEVVKYRMKTKNIKGLFRIPNDDQRLMVDVVEKKGDEVLDRVPRGVYDEEVIPEHVSEIKKSSDYPKESWEERKTIHDYINYAKEHPGEKLL